MLEDVTISNFALIESVSLDFGKGFTVFSGETGAGKSILIGALSFLLGGKGGTDVIRTGCQEARVSGTFLVGDNQAGALAWLEDHGLEPDNGRVLLRRFIRDTGKTGAWIQDTPVTRSELTEFASFLVDIHGQHEHQSLMRVSEHRRFLDAYAGLTNEVEDFTAKYAELVEKRKKLDELNSSYADRARKIELLSFAVKEIEEAGLKDNEDDDLSTEENRLSKFEQIYSDIESVSQMLFGGNSGELSGSVLSGLKKTKSFLSQAAVNDSSLKVLDNRLENVFYELSDIAEEIRAFQNGLVFDPSRLEQIQDRLALIFKLKKKYATSVQSSLSEVLEYCENAKKELEGLGNSEQSIFELQASVENISREVYSAAKKLSERRRKAADRMASEVKNVLSVLGMKGAEFCVSIKEKPETNDGVMQKCGPYGMDDVEFLISANTGSPPKPLAKIASGGELSRVMLALKTILADSDPVETLVFDEIDTGIGGEISVAVGAHLKQLSRKSQIFCITHVASIASYADNQIKISKSSDAKSTVTNVRLLSPHERVEEIARMLSGNELSSASLEHAHMLLDKFGG